VRGKLEARLIFIAREARSKGKDAVLIAKVDAQRPRAGAAIKGDGPANATGSDCTR